MVFPKLDNKALQDICNILKNGGVGVIPTDTLYGIVGSALNPQTVERVYKLRKRDLKKPMIILISSTSDLDKFSVQLSSKDLEILNKIWPNKVSVVLPCSDKKFHYLHRAKNSLAFRIPKDKNLKKILKKLGPLIAPSANLEGEKPAKNLAEAQNYFGSNVDFYLDGGDLTSLPSTIIELKNREIKVLREGEWQPKAIATL